MKRSNHFFLEVIHVAMIKINVSAWLRSKSLIFQLAGNSNQSLYENLSLRFYFTKDCFFLIMFKNSSQSLFGTRPSED